MDTKLNNEIIKNIVTPEYLPRFLDKHATPNTWMDKAIDALEEDKKQNPSLYDLPKKIRMKHESDTIESYIMKLITECQLKLNDASISKESFQYYAGARDYLYMVLTGHENPQANPKIKQKHE